MNAIASSLPSQLKSTLGRLLGGVLNRAVQLDPGLPAQLATLEGRRLELHLSAPVLACAVTVRAGRIEIGPATSDTSADLILGTSLAALAARLLPGGGAGAGAGAGAAPGRGRMHINGDAELARHLQQLLRDYAPDVEGLFVAQFGDVLGVQLAQGLRAALARARAGGRALARDGAQFLAEESQDLVAKAELEAFAQDVEALSEAVERVERRLRRQGLLQGLP